ncbi:O-antigen ligase family protein [Patescibacteria group bacterium]|nr:O-antigen ligase family protein [Patescibacteria group bacterium]MBU1931639.1 O-antigen ligase family protein [Patescibacteria group bacterium]
MKKLGVWLNKYFLSVWAVFLLFFIPLYPKLPLLDILPGYIVRIRLEDFFIAFAWLLLAYQLIKQRIQLKKAPLFKPIAIYLIIGFLSCLSALFITKTVPLELIHAGKLWLHYFRRIEYFSLFFIFYFGFKALPKKWQARAYFPLLPILLIVALYGFGQKYFYWPVYLTMNREFSKGMKLYLTEHARVSSTFGGHYDLAAFLVILLPLILALFYAVSKKLLKLAFLLGFSAGFWLLILTASRTSFIAYLASVGIFFFLMAIKKGFKWSLLRGGLVIFLSIFIMLFFGDLSSRYAHFVSGIKKYPGICFTVEPKEAKEAELIAKPVLPGGAILEKEEDKTKTASESAVCRALIRVNEKINLEKLAELIQKAKQSKLVAWLKPKPKKPDASQVVTKTDEVPVPVRPLPPDVYEDIPLYPTASPSAESAIATATLTPAPAPVGRTYSDNAYKYGLSAAIRLDALWPLAWEGFERNPLLGSGYSTLTKVKPTDFTEAESTDNDYLRMLGETGLLGSLSFLAIFGVVCYQAWQSLIHSRHVYDQLMAGAIIALVVGLLINAVYIDIFEASKVAYMLWAVVGIFFATRAKLKINPPTGGKR